MQGGEEDAARSALLAAQESLGLTRLESFPVQHCAHAFGIVLESSSGWKVAVSGDTRPCAAVANAAKDATLLIHEVRSSSPLSAKRSILALFWRVLPCCLLPARDDRMQGRACCSVVWQALPSSGPQRLYLPELGKERSHAEGAVNDALQATFESSLREGTSEYEFEQEALMKRHSMTHEAVQTGKQAGAYRTVLTHFSQRYPKIPIVDSSFQESTCIAFDLMSVNLKGEPRAMTHTSATLP